MTIIDYKLIAALIILISAVVGVLPALKARKSSHHWTHIGEAFAGGVFFGAALLHMLPDAVDGLQSAWHADYPFAELICVAGFMFLFMIEKLALGLTHKQGESNGLFVALLLAFILSIHSLIAGAALGVNASFQGALVIFLAIIAHKSTASFALGIKLARSKMPLSACLIAFAIFAFMAPVGILIGSDLLHVSQNYPAIEPIFDAFAAGTFLYIATLYQADYLRQCHHVVQHIIAFLLGTGIMALIAVWM